MVKDGAGGSTEKDGRPADTGEAAASPAAAVRVDRELLWINECFPLEDGRHEHVSVYLLQGPESSVVVDSGSFYHRDSIRARLHRAVEERGLDALVLSHSDYPHAGNIGAFREEWGDIDIVASSAAPDIQGLPYATKCTIGESMTVRGREMTFVDPPLADRSHTTWIYDHGTRALFTSDGFGNFHEPGECGWTSGQFLHGIRPDDIYRFHRETLSWLRYVHPPRLQARLREIFDDFRVDWICPIHGNVIAGADLDAYLERLTDSVRRIAEEYPGPGA